MKVTYLLALALAVVVLPRASEALAQDTISPLAPLSQFAGTWEKKFTIHKSEWAPEKSDKTGVHTVEWILNKSHLQETGRDSDGATYISIYSYDAAKKEFLVSAFQSTGTTWSMNGQWDDQLKTMTWSRTLDGGIRMKAVYRLINADEFHFSHKADDGNGKIYFRLEGTGKRTKATK